MKKHRKFLKDLQTSEQFYNDQESRQIIGELIAMIDEGFNKQKADWIPCEERLPENDTNVIACFSCGTVTELRYLGNGIFQGIYEYNTKVIVAWQPLPAPYKKEGDSDAI